MNKKVTICMVVHNGEQWLSSVLDSLKAQTYSNIEVIIRDNASTDGSARIVSPYLATSSWKLETDSENLGFWAGFEILLPKVTGEYVIALTDVILDSHFVERAVAVMEQDGKIGALQAKILQPGGLTIDTVGFQIERSRRVTNRGHGELDSGQYEQRQEIFAVEGAVPVFRLAAINDSAIDGHFIDPDYRVGPLGYGDDLDFAWRMRLFGWKQVYAPDVIAYHDRSTTQGVARSVGEHLSRVAIRRRIPLAKRRLDWSNVRFTIIKNDYIINVLRDLPSILAREIAVFGYTLLFEPSMLAEIGRFLHLLPVMLARRRQVMENAVTSPAKMRTFFT